jgi:hypothetical protein
MVEVYLNLFPLTVKSLALYAYEIGNTEPRTRNRTVRFRLAANIAKKLSKDKGAVFSMGDRIYSSGAIEELRFEDTLDIDGTQVKFTVQLQASDEAESAVNVEQSTERLLNKLVDWYCRETNSAYFHQKNANYLGKNIFANMCRPSAIMGHR